MPLNEGIDCEIVNSIVPLQFDSTVTPINHPSTKMCIQIQVD